MRNVTVRQLQMFVEAADTASFTRAAERLRVSPAAVSFQIKQIEDGTGSPCSSASARRSPPPTPAALCSPTPASCCKPCRTPTRH